MERPPLGFVLIIFLFVGVTARANPSDGVPGTTAPPPPTEPTPELLSSTLLETSTRLQTIHSSLPARSALLIFTGHSDPRRMSELNKRKAAFESSIRKGLPMEQLSEGERWTAADMRDLEEAVELAKRGLLFLGVKG